MNCSKLSSTFAIASLLFTTSLLMADDAKLKVQVDPRDAAVFVDGEPAGHSAEMLQLSPGEHTIGVYDYGFTPKVQKVRVNAGENPELTVKLEAIPGEVVSRWGSLEIKGINGGYFVFLNGKGPDFYVGRVDETKGEKVVLPPGMDHVIIVNPDGNREVYSGYVKIVADQKATLHVDKSDTYYEKWAAGKQLHALPRYGPTTVAVEPVSGQANAYPAYADCGQPVRLVWTSNGYNTLLKLNGVAVGQGGGSGEQIVNPTQTTTYFVETFGPGGVTTTPVTVHVNNTVKTSLNANPTVIHYHKIGDKIVANESATLNWSASNAQSVVLDPVGPVSGSNGTHEVKFSPSKDDYGPLEETRLYKITATNPCGGSDSSTALVQMAGSIDPEPIADKPAKILPQTASPLPLIGLLGSVFLAGGLLMLGLRRLRTFHIGK